MMSKDSGETYVFLDLGDGLLELLERDLLVLDDKGDLENLDTVTCDISNAL